MEQVIRHGATLACREITNVLRSDGALSGGWNDRKQSERCVTRMD